MTISNISTTKLMNALCRSNPVTEKTFTFFSPRLQLLKTVKPLNILEITTITKVNYVKIKHCPKRVQYHNNGIRNFCNSLQRSSITFNPQTTKIDFLKLLGNSLPAFCGACFVLDFLIIFPGRSV